MSARRWAWVKRNTATTVFLAAVGLLLGYLCYQIVRPFLVAIAWATILAVVFEPLHQRVRGAFRRESLSAGVSTAVVILVAVLPFVLLGVTVAREVAQGYRQVAAGVSEGASPETAISQMPGVGPAWQWVQARLGEWGIELDSVADDALRRGGEFALGAVKGTVTNVSHFILNIVLVAFTLFFFFRDGPLILRSLQRASPIRTEAAYQTYGLISGVIRAAVNGVVVIGIVKGLLAGLAFWALGVPSPALWGTVSAFASVIPMVGPAVVWVPAAAVLALQGHPVKALVLAAWGVTVLGLIDNVLYPILVRGQVRLHTLLVFFRALGGLAVFGFLGFVLGPVVVTLAVTLVEVASEYYSGQAATDSEAVGERAAGTGNGEEGERGS